MRQPDNIGTICFIALGSNIGNREQYLLSAIEALDKHEHISVTAVSDIYETEPVGYTEQDAFLNMVIAVRTDLSPELLFEHMVYVEQLLGRTREVRWGPRTIDIDLLRYGQLHTNTEHLTLPHPRMMERAFVLVPLLDIYERLGLPPESLSTRLETLDGKEGVKFWKKRCPGIPNTSFSKIKGLDSERTGGHHGSVSCDIGLHRTRHPQSG